MRRLNIDQARRYALAAQGLTEPRASGRVDVRHFRKVLDRLKVIQLDSVNVFSRTHYMPFFTRLGSYDREALDGWLWRSGELFEYWGHMASLLPAKHHSLFRWRMQDPLSWQAYRDLREKKPGFVESVLDQVAERGPIQTKDLADPGERLGRTMWNWNDGKIALEALFADGHVTTADRRGFVRMYDITERVVPMEHLEASSPGREEAQSALLLEAADAMGVATADDLADYYRIRMPEARPLIERLADRGELVEVEVEGWDRPAYLHPRATLARRSTGPALLSPFDNLIWYRDRVERLWDFHYRIEIYVPEAKRVYGYYVLPFLLDGDLVARVDLKTDRQAGVLRVKGAFAEPGVDRTAVGRALGEELELVASWLGMGRVDIAANGDLHAFL
ncbi:MAG: crosslink repair DNA glycosylase YcaQ family protein [Acidimicrobiia bacterium]|nr:crosslink repair DNA glycosylase YcaQ family protein [Acidimicrobiia bacterium]